MLTVYVYIGHALALVDNVRAEWLEALGGAVDLFIDNKSAIDVAYNPEHQVEATLADEDAEPVGGAQQQLVPHAARKDTGRPSRQHTRQRREHCSRAHHRRSLCIESTSTR